MDRKPPDARVYYSNHPSLIRCVDRRDATILKLRIAYPPHDMAGGINYEG